MSFMISVPELLDGSKETRLCIRSDGSDRWQRHREPGRCKNTGTEVVLVFPAVIVVSFLSGSAHRDGFLHFLGLRVVVLETLRRPSGQLLRQRQSATAKTLRRS